MITVICTILAIVIKDLEVRLNNLNLPSKKSVIQFKSLAHKGETIKQIAVALYYKY